MRTLFFLLFLVYPFFSAASQTQNLYDSAGRLVARCTAEAGCSYLLYTGNSNDGVVENNTYQDYQYGPGGRAALIARKSDNAPNVHLLVGNFQQTVIAEITSGDIIQYQFDAFGNQLNPDQTAAGTGAIFTDKLQLDSSSSTYNYNARNYASKEGRFLSTDPIAPTADPFNWYTYANNNPILFTDPTGREADATMTSKGAELELQIYNQTIPIEKMLAAAYAYLSKTKVGTVVRRGSHKTPYYMAIKSSQSIPEGGVTSTRSINNQLVVVTSLNAQAFAHIKELSNKDPHFVNLVNLLAHEETHALELLNAIDYGATSQAEIDLWVGSAYEQELRAHTVGDAINHEAQQPSRPFGSYLKGNTTNSGSVEFTLPQPPTPGECSDSELSPEQARILGTSMSGPGIYHLPPYLKYLER